MRFDVGIVSFHDLTLFRIFLNAVIQYTFSAIRSERAFSFKLADIHFSIRKFSKVEIATFIDGFHTRILRMNQCRRKSYIFSGFIKIVDYERSRIKLWDLGNTSFVDCLV